MFWMMWDDVGMVLVWGFGSGCVRFEGCHTMCRTGLHKVWSAVVGGLDEGCAGSKPVFFMLKSELETAVLEHQQP